MNYLFVALLVLAFGGMQLLIGGVRLAFSLPFYGMIAGTAVLAVVTSFWRRNGERKEVIRFSCIGFASLMIGYLVYREDTSPIEYLARTDLYMVLAAAVVYLLFAVCFTRIKERLASLWILLAFAMAQVVCGIIQFKKHSGWMAIPWFGRLDTTSWRASGFYICPNHYAGLLEMLGLICISLTIWSRFRLAWRILIGYLGVICFVGLAFSGSRGGYLSTVAGTLFFGIYSICVVFSVRRNWFWPMFVVGSIVLAGVIFGAIHLMSASDALRDRLGQVYDPTNMRLLMWAAAMKQYALNHWWGTGAGTYLYYGRQFRAASVQNDPVYVHNDYLHLLCEYGILGCIAVGVVIVTHLFSGIAGIRSIVREKLKPSWATQSNELALLIGTLSAVGALIVHSIVDFNLHIPVNTLIVAALFGILASPMSRTEKGKVPWTRVSLMWTARLACLGLAGFILVKAMPLVRGEYYAERARVALRDQKLVQASEFARLGIVTEKKNPDLYFYLGESQHLLSIQSTVFQTRVENAKASIEAFQNALALFPNDLRCLLKLARTYDENGRFKDAEGVLLRALEADPNFGNVYAYLGYHYQRKMDLDKAEALYKKALNFGENDVATAGMDDIKKARENPNFELLREFILENASGEDTDEL